MVLIYKMYTKTTLFFVVFYIFLLEVVIDYALDIQTKT